MVLLESMTERGSIISSFQPSLSEWLRAIGHADAEALQVEDVGKRDRLEGLRQIIGINYDRVTSFPAADFYARIRQVADFISEHGEDLCAMVHTEEILKTIRVTDPEVRARLCDELDSEFTSEGFLVGYFETLLWPTKLIFIDYNRQLHKMSEPPCAVMEKRKGRDTSLCSDGATDGQEETRVIVKGIQAGTGEVEGVVRIVTDDALDEIEFNQGDILVTDNTDVRFLPLMRKAGAVVTNRGGMLSHAAIIARELGVPCVVGCGDATHKFVEGQVVQVDATRGLILSLSPPPGA